MDVVHWGVGHFLQYSKNLNVNFPPYHGGGGGGGKQMTDALCDQTQICEFTFIDLSVLKG